MSNKLKVIGLALVAVFAFSAISAVAAQAAPKWTVAGAALAAGKEEAVKEAVELTPAGSKAVLTVPNFLRLSCGTLGIVGGKIIGTNKDSASGIKFTGCQVLSKTGETTHCTVKNFTSGTIGTIMTESNTSELKKDATSGNVFDVFTPGGSSLVIIRIDPATGFSCALTGTYTISGTAALEVQTGTNAVKLEGTGSEAIQKTAGAKLLFGERESFLDGTGDLELVSMKTWGVDAE